MLTNNTHLPIQLEMVDKKLILFSYNIFLSIMPIRMLEKKYKLFTSCNNYSM